MTGPDPAGATLLPPSGRYADEGPQHEVRIRQGFWLFDTLCTQALWHAVMGDNTSRFKLLARPVESGSFGDLGGFLTLPSEAQWEYAWRAGPMDIGPDRRAAVLDTIAWYAGNSGGKTHKVKQNCRTRGACTTCWAMLRRGAKMTGTAPTKAPPWMALPER